MKNEIVSEIFLIHRVWNVWLQIQTKSGSTVRNTLHHVRVQSFGVRLQVTSPQIEYRLTTVSFSASGGNSLTLQQTLVNVRQNEFRW